MKFQYCSDLHLEFRENKEYLRTNPLLPLGDILILAGDIVPFKVLKQHDDFFDYVSKNFETTYWIPGNHEYYYFDLAKKQGCINEKIRENVFLVNNIAVQVQDVKLICSTLWTHIDVKHQFAIQQSLSDFHVIGYDGKMLNPINYNNLHKDSLSFIRKELKSSKNEKNIVVSHHVPTFLNYPEKYKGDFLNEAFAVELYDMIEKSKPDAWIFGHHHSNINDFTIGKTQMLTNQLGYIKYNENIGFCDKIINF
ncbi:MAG: metallophosphoesterase [Bacteroidetes bacterium HGW-Bacteroidetes-21]|jgi:predicted phosphohydrolase|nr:MAG: metallophosphoesterase [Bacteroidetes bacterium HGW-Bacteroidetes-21]